MAKFIFLYRGAATDMSSFTPEQVEEVMGQWGAWAGEVGPALLDMGNPFGPSVSVVDDGSEAAASGLNGYGIVEADSLEAAKGLTKNHPFLTDDKGDFAIDIFELMPM